MLHALEAIIDDINGLQSKLIVVLGCDAERLLFELGVSRRTTPINIGSVVGKELTKIPSKNRSLEVSKILRNQIESFPADTPALLGHIELLFDKTLRLSPVEVLKQLSRQKPIIVTWPGELRHERLSYAEVGHPEHRDYSTDGLVLFDSKTLKREK